METRPDHFLWVEKYRPQCIDDCILPPRLKAVFKEQLKAEVFQNMLLQGPPGTGKTTVAKALCKQLGLDLLVINSSENGNIDTLRTTIRSFASTISMTGGFKVVLLDEFDYSNAQSTQPALRNFMEEFSKNCRFIMTANQGNRIIPALKSRCVTIDFSMTKAEKRDIIMSIDKRVKEILAAENVTYSAAALQALVMKFFPDFRKIIQELQRMSLSGDLTEGAVASMTEDSVGVLFTHLKDKDFSKMRKWVVDNLDSDFTVVQRALYDRMLKHVAPESIPPLCLILAEYDYKNSFVADKEINLVAMLTQVMIDAEFL